MKLSDVLANLLVMDVVDVINENKYVVAKDRKSLSVEQINEFAQLLDAKFLKEVRMFFNSRHYLDLNLDPSLVGKKSIDALKNVANSMMEDTKHIPRESAKDTVAGQFVEFVLEVYNKILSENGISHTIDHEVDEKFADTVFDNLYFELYDLAENFMGAIGTENRMLYNGELQ